jgi:hypothetical protein
VAPPRPGGVGRTADPSLTGPVPGPALSLRKGGEDGRPPAGSRWPRPGSRPEPAKGGEDGVLFQAAASVRGPAGPVERRAAAARMARALVRRSARARWT